MVCLDGGTCEFLMPIALWRATIGYFFWCSKQFFYFFKDFWFALVHLTPGYINVAISLKIRYFMKLNIIE